MKKTRLLWNWWSPYWIPLLHHAECVVLHWPRQCRSGPQLWTWRLESDWPLGQLNTLGRGCSYDNLNFWGIDGREKRTEIGQKKSRNTHFSLTFDILESQCNVCAVYKKEKNILKIMRIQKLEPRSSHPSGSCREVMVAPREMQVSFTPFLLVIV